MESWWQIALIAAACAVSGILGFDQGHAAGYDDGCAEGFRLGARMGSLLQQTQQGLAKTPRDDQQPERAEVS